MPANDAFPQAFCEQLTAELAAAGWDRSRFEGALGLTFTRPLGGGFQAVIRVTGSIGSHPGLPMSAEAATGVGYEPATALTPRLTLPPSPLMVATGEPDETESSRPDKEVNTEHDLDRFRARVVKLARDRAERLARRYAGLEEMEAALRADSDDFPETALETLPVFLAATGRAQEALGLVGEHLASDLEDTQERRYRRFARQLRLWAEAGAPPPPPLEAWPVDTWAWPFGNRPRMTLTDRLAERAAGREALNAVREQARGKSQPELVALLTAEHARRNIDVSPAAMAVQARMLQLEQRPFGKLLAGMAALQTGATLTRGMVGGFRHAFDEQPAWLDPPDDALFEVPSAHRASVPVRIDPDAEPWLAQVAAGPHPTPQLLTHCEAWLRPADAPEGDAENLDVFIGQHLVGRLDGSAAAAFRPALTAASRYQELPVVPCQLLWSTEGVERTLALDGPLPVPQPPSF